MPFFDTTWYLNAGDQSTTGYYAIAKRPQNTAVVAGQLCRQFTAPAVGNERVFICTVAGTTANTTDATWTLSRGGRTTDGTATWQECTGMSAVNGDKTNTPDWASIKTLNISVGVIIKRNSGTSYHINATAAPFTANSASEPAFSDVAGSTVAESGGGVWTCLGPVGNFTGGQAPFARLQSVFGANWFAAGNTIYVGDNHNEVQSGSYGMSPTGSVSIISKIISHNHSGPYPPAAGDLMPGASIAVTTFHFNFNPSGSWYLYGLTFKYGVGGSGSVQASVGAAAGGQAWLYLDRCSLELHTTYNVGVTASSIMFGSTGATGCSFVVLNNTTVRFGGAGQYLQLMNCNLLWQNTGPVLVAGSTVPSRLLDVVMAQSVNNATLEALDLSQIAGGLYGIVGGSNSAVTNCVIKDCKLNAAATVFTPVNSGQTVQLVRSSA